MIRPSPAGSAEGLPRMSLVDSWTRDDAVAAYLTTEYTLQKIVSRSTVPMLMQEFLESPPNSVRITAYDRKCFKLYLELLEADNACDHWEIAYKSAFGADPAADEARCRSQYDSHLTRARWMSSDGFRLLK